MKNIIFDIGSVLIGYRWQDMCRDAGWDKEKADRIGRGFFLNPLWPDFDAGLITTEELIGSVAEEHPGLEKDARWFITGGKKMIVERPKVWELAVRLKEKGFGHRSPRASRALRARWRCSSMSCLNSFSFRSIPCSWTISRVRSMGKP